MPTDLAAGARAIARQLRRAEEAEAAEALAAWTLHLEAEVAPQALVPLAAALGEVFAAQQRGDSLRVADVLEFVVAPGLAARA
jgi:hypothetical protein